MPNGSRKSRFSRLLGGTVLLCCAGILLAAGLLAARPGAASLAQPAATGTPSATPTAGTASTTPSPAPTGTPYLTFTPLPTGTPANTATPGTPTATRTPGCSSGWDLIPSPNQGAVTNWLAAVSVHTATDVWAAGYSQDTASGPDTPLLLHWAGSGWTIVPSAYLTYSAALNGVAALASNDVWAAGQWQDPVTQYTKTLIGHWDGATWSYVASPSPGLVTNELSGIAARTPSDIWAAGSADGHTLIEHWDGSAWSVVPSPDGGTQASYLMGASARAADDAWAVGITFNTGGPEQTLVEHWDGSTWSVVPSPSPGTSANCLYVIAALAANNVWAVGETRNDTQTVHTMVQHWDGTGWQVVSSPNSGADWNSLWGMASLGADDIWAGGFATTGSLPDPLIERWDGAQWSVVTAPGTGTGDELLGMDAAGLNDVWAVGFAGNMASTLIEHYSGPCPTLTPTATRTPPVPPSPTRPAPPTHSPTAPPCSVAFSDVHATDYFSTPVLYLACRGVISGYGDGTFRPFAQTTRAQLIKIAVLGFGTPSYTPPAGAYTFTDVPPAYPFWSVIETAAHAGLVAGYACGGPGEPCDPQQRLYFRPAADVTRGQLAKIVAQAAGWPGVTPSTPTFADVLPGSAFYPYVEAAACRNILSGYSCGGPGEPCDPQNRPYFRQGNPATRGQIAKIVYGAILAPPGCALAPPP